MSGRQLTRRNHYVPESYLKRWAGLDGKLWAFRLLVSHLNVREWQRVTPSGVGYREHLYTQMAVGGLSDIFEQWLSRDFEGPAEPVIGRVIDGAPMRPEDWQVLARFVACQDVRTPAQLVVMLKRQAQQMPSILDDTLQGVVSKLKAAHDQGQPLSALPPRPTNEGRIPSRVSIEPSTDPKDAILRVEVIIGRESWLSSLHHLLTKTSQVLEKHRWTVLRPPVGFQWVTSDNPVVKLNVRSRSDYDFGGGWRSAGTQIILPLGPEHLLYTRIGDTRPPRRGTRLDRDKALGIQQVLIEHADRVVFASTKDEMVPRHRPRLVDADRSRLEATQWREWHADQLAAEQSL